MSQQPGEFLGKHKRIIVLAAAISVLAMYALPLDGIYAAVSGKPVSSNAGGSDKGNKNDDNGPKDNNCENGLPPHKNGNTDNGNHYGCLKQAYRIIAN